MWPSIADRVPAQSDPEINAQLHEAYEARIADFAGVKKHRASVKNQAAAVISAAEG